MALSTVSPVRRALTGETGTALPAFVDHHVHLHVVDGAGLAARGIAAVVDLGGDPAALARRAPGLPRLAYAGAFLTARGGYPRGRPWAPDDIVREVWSASLHPGVAGGARTDAVSTFIAGAVPASPDDIPTWLSRATVVPTEELARAD